MATKAERIEAANAAHRKRCRTRLEAAGEHVQDLALNRHIWRTTTAIAGSSAVVAQYPYFMYWVSAQYAQAACVSIRRLTESGDNANDTNSLVAVLEDIAEHRDAYPWVPWMPDDYRGADDHIDHMRVRRDVAALRDAADVVTRYVNKHLAHLERIATVAAPTLVDVDNAIDLLGTMLQRYLLLTTGQNLASVTPLLMFDWTSVFTQPWRPK